jgi:hypothetical protein
MREKRDKLKYADLERGKLYKQKNTGVLFRLTATGLQFFDKNACLWKNIKARDLLDKDLIFSDY